MNALLLALLLIAQQPEDLGQKINAAAQLVDAGKVDDAIAAFKQILAEHPDNETAQYELGLAYMAKGDAENCRKTLEPLADSTTNNRAVILSLLGNCLDDLGQRDKAVETYRRGLKIAPKDPDLNFNLALTLTKMERYDEAREVLKTDTRANPWHASAHLLLARVFEIQNYRVPAIFSYLHFLALEPSPRAADAAAHVQSLLNLGVKKTEEGANITIESEPPKGEGDYGGMALMLGLVAAGQDKKQSELERAQAQVALTIGLFIEDAAKKRDNYTAAVHQPFFAAMEKAKLVDTFAAIAVTPLKLNGTDDWVKAHAADLARYGKWIDPQLKR